MSNAPFIKLSKDLGPGSNKDGKNQSTESELSATLQERTNSCSFQDQMEKKNSQSNKKTGLLFHLNPSWKDPHKMQYGDKTRWHGGLHKKPWGHMQWAKSSKRRVMLTLRKQLLGAINPHCCFGSHRSINGLVLDGNDFMIRTSPRTGKSISTWGMSHMRAKIKGAPWLSPPERHWTPTMFTGAPPNNRSQKWPSAEGSH